VPTAASVGSNSYLTMLGYLLVTAAAVFLTVRGRDPQEGADAVRQLHLGDAARAGPLRLLRRYG
jgi:hypothetical protein